MSMKNSNDTIGNRTRDLPACSTMPQPTTLPHTPVIGCIKPINCNLTVLFYFTLKIWGFFSLTSRDLASFRATSDFYIFLFNIVVNGMATSSKPVFSVICMILI
jgi:hypothetical protein